MTSTSCWAIVMLASAVGTALAFSMAEHAWAERNRSWRPTLVAGAVGAVVLISMGLLYNLSAVAEGDASVVARMALSRNADLVDVMTVVTLMGDVVPTLLMAAVLALLIYRQGIHRIACWTLPVVIVAEFTLQLAVGDTFNTMTIADIEPEVPLSGHGDVPSGSVARLFSLFLISSYMWSSHDRQGSRRLAALGGVLVVIEIASRLYLGRHLIGDIAGGLGLGLVLAAAGSMLVSRRAVQETDGGSRR